MAKLVILRGDVRHTEIALPANTVRIGRSPQNEIVLEDSGKGVSRTHAEIRFEDGRHVLADNASQNGIWVDGSRVPSVVLEPGVVASLGPYRLMVEGDDVTVDAASADVTTEAPTRIARPTESAEEQQPSRTERAVTARESTKRQIPAGTTAATKSSRRDVLATAVAALLVIMAGLAVYTLMQPQDNIANPPDPLAAATGMVDAGNCTEAMTQHVEPALARNPNDVRALDLKKRCTPATELVSSPPPSPLPPPPTRTELLLDEAEGLMSTGRGSSDGTTCRAVLDKANQVLTEEPGNAHAAELKSRSEVCLQQLALAKRKLATAWIESVKPAEGGLPPWPSETPQAHAARVKEAAGQYAEAQKAGAAGDVESFDRAVRNLPAGFRDVAELRANLEQSRNRSAQATAARNDAKAAEDRGDLKAAEDLYRRAKELDPNISVDNDLRDVSARRVALAKKKCDQADASFSTGLVGPARLKELYSEALKLLRPGEACYQKASERSGQ